VTTARYRLLSPSGKAVEEGSADVTVGGGALMLAPPGADALRVPFDQIASVGEAEQFTLRIALSRGTMIELSRLGAMRTQLLAELRDGQAAAAGRAAGVVGEADAFSGASGGEPAEIRLYDDALLIVTGSGAERVSFCFVQQVEPAGHAVTIRVAGRGPLAVSGLGRRAGEFADALNDRLSASRARAAAFLGALLPGLDPLELRQAAALLRDGLAARTAALDAVHPDLAASLLQAAAIPDRRDAVTVLGRRAGLAIGFRQVASVHRAATGVTPWQDHAAAPHIGEHDRSGGYFGTGFAGMMAAGLVAGLGASAGPGYAGRFGYEGGSGYEGYWAYRALGAGMTASGQHAMAQRADVARGRLTPAGDDLAALTLTGQDPAVLAFVLAEAPGRVAFDVLNLAGPPTLVFRAGGPGSLEAVNRALVDSGFAPREAPGPGAAARPAPLADLLLEAVPHGPNWAARITALLPGGGTDPAGAGEPP